MHGTRRPLPGKVSSSGEAARRSAGSARPPSARVEAEPAVRCRKCSAHGDHDSWNAGVRGAGPAVILTAGMLAWFLTWWFLLPVWSRLRHSAGLSPRR